MAPRRDTHHIEIIRIDHWYGRARVDIGVFVLIVIIVEPAMTYRSRTLSWWWASTTPHPHLLLPQG
jgi:hypothetical protein